MLNIKNSNHWPFIGMIHTNSNHSISALSLAKKEIEIYLRHGIYPLIENYFGTTAECEEILEWMQANHPDTIYGVNILGNYREAFRLADKYGASFIQIDSVCGHLTPEADIDYAEELQELRKKSKALVLGGVRFKYQPVRSGRSLEEDLMLGSQRCDAIVCTGEGTGIPTPMGKVKEFKAILERLHFPVIVGAGVTLDAIEETFLGADGAIVGSWMKDGHRDAGEVNEDYVRQMTGRISLLRNFHDIFSGLTMRAHTMRKDLVFENIHVDLWRKELQYCSVTVTFDNVLHSVMDPSEWKICIICKGNDRVEHQINLATVDQISSGVRFRGIANVPKNYSAAIYDISPDYVKEKIVVPPDLFVGFPWYHRHSEQPDKEATIVPVNVFNGRYVLNFTVAGEFDAGVFLFNPRTKELKNLFLHSFCCK